MTPPTIRLCVAFMFVVGDGDHPIRYVDAYPLYEPGEDPVDENGGAPESYVRNVEAVRDHFEVREVIVDISLVSLVRLFIPTDIDADVSPVGTDGAIDDIEKRVWDELAKTGRGPFTTTPAHPTPGWPVPGTWPVAPDGTPVAGSGWHISPTTHTGDDWTAPPVTSETPFASSDFRAVVAEFMKDPANHGTLHIPEELLRATPEPRRLGSESLKTKAQRRNAKRNSK